MRIGRWIGVVVCAAAVLVAGCSEIRALDVDGPVATWNPNPSLDAVEKAIIRAGAITDWRISREGPGTLSGFRQLGGHHAWISITYSERQYSIRLRESSMARESAVPRFAGPSGGAGAHAGTMQPPGGRSAGGDPVRMVHRVYNQWVEELDRHIRAQLSAI